MTKKPIHTKTARAKLAPAREPYWDRVRTGLHVGYRKLDSGSGTWIGRYKAENGKYQFKSFGDGLEYDDAVRSVQAWADELAVGVNHDPRDLTVSDVCRLYVEDRRVEKGAKNALDAERRFKRLVYDKPFGNIVFTKLKDTNVKNWRNAQLEGKEPDDEESYNRAKDTINRELTTLKAALNFGKRSKLVSTDIGWKAVNAFPNVAVRRKGWLTAEERNRLLGSMSNDLRVLATALLLIGARPGELANANIPDFDKNAGTLYLDGKTGRREIPLSAKAREFFTQQTKDRIGNVPLLVRSDGRRWTSKDYWRLFVEAREKAKLPDAVMYCFRHTYISEAIAQGLDVYTVATLTGTSVKIIESNYGTLTDNIVERLNKISIL